MPFNLTNWLMRSKIEEQRRVINPYHAVGIAPGSSCCNAIIDLKDRRFLSAAAPKIPLPSCDVASCRCRYVHFKDRRDGDVRRQLIGNPLGHQILERRHGSGSRHTD